MLNMKELLEEHCGFKLPEMPCISRYEKQGPSFIVHLHPALGPVFAIIGQKIHHGELSFGSELILEIAELSLSNLKLEGSLIIQAESVMGQTTDHILKFGNENGKCELKNVSVKNRGLSASQETPYWKNHLKHEEKLHIILKGNAEFLAENITFEGNLLIEVPSGYRYIAYQDRTEVKFKKEQIQQSTWYWDYAFDENDQVKIKKI
jgi:hypothetical protein